MQGSAREEGLLEGCRVLLGDGGGCMVLPGEAGCSGAGFRPGGGCAAGMQASAWGMVGGGGAQIFQIFVIIQADSESCSTKANF